MWLLTFGFCIASPSGTLPGYEASFCQLPSVMQQLGHDVGNKQSDFTYMKSKIQFEVIIHGYNHIVMSISSEILPQATYETSVCEPIFLG